MNAEQLEELKEQMKSMASSLARDVLSEIREELKTEQHASLTALESEITCTVAKLAKKVDDLEKTLSATAFANRVLEDFYMPACASSPASTTTSITTSIASTACGLPTYTSVASSSLPVSTAQPHLPLLAGPGVTDNGLFALTRNPFGVHQHYTFSTGHQLASSGAQQPLPALGHQTFSGPRQLPVSGTVQQLMPCPRASSALPQLSSLADMPNQQFLIGSTFVPSSCSNLAQPPFAANHRPHSSPNRGMFTSAFMTTGGSTVQQPSALVQPNLNVGQQSPLVSTLAPSRSGLGNFTCNLAPFDGTVSWSDYRTQFEIVARNNSWTEQEKADAMATQLRGNALSVLSVFPRGHLIKYEELVSLLEQRFGIDSYSSQVQFCGRSQGPKESFANFALELQRLATTAFPSCPTDVVDRMAALRFLEGIRDDELRTLVKVRGPKSLHEAVNAAQELATGIGNTRTTRVFTAQTTTPASSQGRRQRRQGQEQQPLTRDAQGLPNGASLAAARNSSTLYNSFVPASQSNVNPSTSADPGNLTSSSLGGMIR